jgi:glutamate-1-semialdehyde 2,1-aminomutase
MAIKEEILKSFRERVKKLLPGGVHYNFHLPWEETPIHFVKSKNSRLWDMDGNQYLDFYARFGAMIVGHSNYEYGECLKETIDRVLCVSHSDIDIETLELMAKYIPSAEMIRFGLSGTEIVQNALRLARAWTGKNRFVRFEGHYHGNADNIMGGKAHRPSYIPVDFLGDLKGTMGRAEGALETQSYLLPWNDADVLEALLIQHGDEIAAVITEPVCVNAGSIMPAPGYLKKMRELCSQYGVVLIFDEIITGVRTGLGGAQTAFDVIPDLTTLGKAIGGGGIPVSALVGKREIMQLLVDKSVIHAGTFNGYPLGMAAVKVTFELLSRNQGQAIHQMNENMLKIHQIFKEQADTVDLPLVIQGPPGCASYHCCQHELRDTRAYTYEIMALDIILNDNLAKNGILVSTFSRLYPNISLSQADIQWFEERVRKSLLATKEVYDSLLEEA